MIKKNIEDKMVESKANSIKKAWQESVAEIQRAQINHMER